MEIAIGIDGFCIRPATSAEKIIYAYKYKCMYNSLYRTRNVSTEYLNKTLAHIKRR